MADKSVGELIAAKSVTPTDLFVLEQNGTAKKLTGQILENWLVSFADGHGGIQSIAKLSTSDLADTYRITLADTTTFDFVVTNGRSITGISKTSTSGLADTYTIKYNDGTTGTFIVTNGAKGDKGDNQYVWIKYASQKPTASSHSFGDVADNWIGIYSGDSATAPTDWTQYEWFQIKGEKGDTGDPATLLSYKVEYQVSDSGTIIPSGSWQASVPVVAQGKYLWTRTTNTFNTGNPVVSYSVSRMGLDGSGSVSSVANISPDGNGNVPLTAGDVGAVPSTGGDMTGELRMNGQPISGLNSPAEDSQAANKGYVDTAKEEAKTYANAQVKKAAPRNLLDNSDFRNPVNQRGVTSFVSEQYGIDRWVCGLIDFVATVQSDGIHLKGNGGGFWLKQLIPMGGAVKIGAQLTLAVKKKNAEPLVVVLTVPASGTENSASPLAGNVLQLSTASDGSLVTVAYFGNNANEEYVIEWAALYEGEYTAETLPEYQSKGYAVELAECQRYHREFTWLGGGTNFAPIRVMLPLPFPMRMANPTVTFEKIGGGGEVGISMSSNDAVDISVTGDCATLRIKVNADL